MADRLCILHIGVAKTGTSSIQGWLAGNRPELAKRGFHYPSSIGDRNHVRILTLAEGRVPRAVSRNNVTREQVEQGFAAELKALPDSIHTVIISSEGLGTIKEKVETQRLRDFLAPFFSRFRVVVYLRRQDEQRVSLLSTKFKTGTAVTRPIGRSIDSQAFWNRPFNYERVLNVWSETFGRAAVTPRIFQRSDLVGGDVRQDFASVVGLKDLPLSSGKSEKSNPSIKPEAQEFLRLLNTALGDGAEVEKGRYRRLLRAIEAQFEGAGALPDRATAVALMAKCRASNDRVRAAWFPDRAELFREDFSRYPETVGDTERGDVLAVAMHGLRVLLEKRGGDGSGEAKPARAKPVRPGKDRRKAAA